MEKNNKNIIIAFSGIRIFLDTSVYISALLSDTGASDAILYAAEAGGFELCVSRWVYREAEDILVNKFKLPGLYQRFQLLMDSIRPAMASVSKEEVKGVYKHCRDLNDTPMLAAALKSKSRYFITLDKKSFKQNIFPAPNHLKIVSPGEFMKVFRRLINEKGYFK